MGGGWLMAGWWCCVLCVVCVMCNLCNVTMVMVNGVVVWCVGVSWRHVHFVALCTLYFVAVSLPLATAHWEQG